MNEMVKGSYGAELCHERPEQTKTKSPLVIAAVVAQKVCEVGAVKHRSWSNGRMYVST
jgi:hypothetical protein